MKSRSAFLLSVTQSTDQTVVSTLAKYPYLFKFTKYGPAAYSGASLDLPHAYRLGTAVGNVMAASNNGTIAWTTFGLGTPSSQSLAGGGTISGFCMGPGVNTDGRVWYAVETSTFDIKSALNGGTVVAQGSLPDVVPANGNTLVSRVEAVRPYAGGGWMAVVGHHNFTDKFTTLEFFIYMNSGVRKLMNIVQVNLTETYTNKYACARWAPYAFAASKGAGQPVVVVANTSKMGRPVCFTVSPSGTESEMRQILSFDEELTDVGYTPTGLIESGGLFYLSGYFIRKMTDDTTLRIEQMLISADGVNWSLGEFSSFVTTDACAGAVAIHLGNIYWIGQGYEFVAPVRSVEGASSTAITSSVPAWRVNHTRNGISQGEMSASPDLVLSPGELVTINAGYENNGTPETVKVGEFVIDHVPMRVDKDGEQMMDIQMVDRASFHLNTWASPVDLERWSDTFEFDDLKKLTKLIVKTPNLNISNDDNGLAHNGLNRPMIGVAPWNDDRPGMMVARVRFGTTSTRCTSVFGFVFGGIDEKFGSETTLERVPQFNAATVNKATSWGTAWDTGLVLKSNISPTNGWNIPDHLTGLLNTNQADAYAKMLTLHSGGVADVLWNPVANTDYEIMVRRFGRRVQIYYRPADYGASTIAANAAFIKLSRFDFNKSARGVHGGRVGICLNTDVWADKDAFGNAANDDIVTQLSEVELYNNTYGQGYGMQRSIATGSFNGKTFTLTTGNIAMFQVGMFVHLIVPSVYDRVKQIELVTGTGFDIVGGTAGAGNSCTVYGYTVGTDWATLRTGYIRIVTANVGAAGQTIEMDGGGVAFDKMCGGIAFVVSDDSTAGYVAPFETDGQSYIQKSGFVTATAPDTPTYTAFSFLANPLEDVDTGTNAGGGDRDWLYMGSKPRDWRIIFHQAKIFDGAPSAKGLDDEGYLVVDDEIIRYTKNEYLKRGVYPTETQEKMVWTVVPTFMTSLASVTTPGTLTLTAWNQQGSNIGDMFPGTQKHKGMYVRVLSRSLGSVINLGKKEQHYVVDANAGAKTVTLDKQYTGTIVGPVANKAGGSIALISGRAQFETEFALHSATAPVKLYPLAMSDPPPTAKLGTLIQVKRLGFYFGNYNSVEDDLRAVCAMAGVHNPSFDSLYSYSGTPSGGQSTGVSDADFVAEAVFNPSLGEFQLQFRDYYHLEVTASGSTVTVRLNAYNSAITASGGKKKIWEVPVTVNFGSMAWSAETFRFVVRGKKIKVEMSGQPLVTFDLNFIETYIALGTGTIQLTFPSSLTFRLLDLPDEVENHIIDMGQDGSSALGYALDGRYVYMRSTENGGIHFGRRRTQTNVGAYTGVISEYAKSNSPFDYPTHLSMSGAEVGDAISTRIGDWGYRFGQRNNRLINSVTDAKNNSAVELKLYERETLQHEIEIAGLPWAEQGDKIDVSVTFPDGVPVSESATITIEQIVTMGTGKSLKSRIAGGV